MWIDVTMHDGGESMWDVGDLRQQAEDAGIDPISVNRMFPVTNLLCGQQVQGKSNIVAKARTHKDGELSNLMTESIKFVMDQNSGQALISKAFKDMVVAGFGCLYISPNQNPTKEKIRISQRDWKEIWYDPFSTPWFTPEHTRYVFHQPWMDLDQLIGLFPDKEEELEDVYHKYTGDAFTDYDNAIYQDEATEVEQYRQQMVGDYWADKTRRRVRPVEMWYPLNEEGTYATFSDGRVVQIKDDASREDVSAIVAAAVRIETKTVPKMKFAIFLGDLMILEGASPHSHDEYPFVPFVGYTDRVDNPYGVVRQVRPQNIEINKRRSMMLAMLRSKQVIIEKSVVDQDSDKQRLWEEVQKIDGMIEVNDGKMNQVLIKDNTSLSQAQMQVMIQSETEVQEISGANAEATGYSSNATSGVAMQKRNTRSGIVTATLFDGLARAERRLGELIAADIQTWWKDEKVLRVTDSSSGRDRFEVLNQEVFDENGNSKRINDITQGKFDIIVSLAPHTDTIREQNLELVKAAIQSSTPEMAPTLFQIYFMMSDMPNKDQLIEKIKPMLGQDPREDDMTPEEVKQKTIQQLEAQAQEQQKQQQLIEADAKLELTKKELENTKLQLENAKIQAQTVEIQGNTGVYAMDAEARAKTNEGKLEVDAFKAGHNMQKDKADAQNQSVTTAAKIANQKAKMDQDRPLPPAFDPTKLQNFQGNA